MGAILETRFYERLREHTGNDVTVTDLELRDIVLFCCFLLFFLYMQAINKVKKIILAFLKHFFLLRYSSAGENYGFAVCTRKMNHSPIVPDNKGSKNFHKALV